MTDSPRIHLTVLFEASELPEIAANRVRWDPVMAEGVPPHTTLVYPEEFDDESLLIDRASVAATRFGPFSMCAGEVVVDGENGSGGVFCAVTDPTASWSTLRALILQPPFAPVEVSPHITIVHPRTSRQGADAWAELEGSDYGNLLVVREFCLTSTDRSTGMTVRRHFPLAGGSRQLCAAMVLVDDDGRALLARRSVDRTWHPGVWDLVGGRVEQPESLLSAACRETSEELGVEVDPAKVRHVDTLVTDDAEVVVFTSRMWAGAPRNVALDEHDEIHWFDSASLEGVELAHLSLRHVVELASSKAQ